MEVKTGLGTLGNWELKEEGEDGEEVCVDVVERELHKHSTGPVNTQINTKPALTDMNESKCVFFFKSGLILIMSKCSFMNSICFSFTSVRAVLLFTGVWSAGDVLIITSL